MTNREKFAEVFGFEPKDTIECFMPKEVCNVKNGICCECPFMNFWDKEYKSCFKLDLSKLGG